MLKFVMVLLGLLLSASHAMGFEERLVDDFEMLGQQASVDAFDAEIRNYEVDCLAHSFSGALGQRCFLKRKLWDRELQLIYRSIASGLPEEMQHVFREEQRAWENALGKSERLAQYLIGRQYNQPGTMYITARVKSLDDMISKLIKQRVLVLQEWQQHYLDAERADGWVAPN